MNTTHRAQSNVGLVLLLALTITSAGVVVAIGSAAIEDVQQEAAVDRAVHSMTLLDARTAVVGLGEGSVQTLQLAPSGSGRYTVAADRGWLRITHRNYTAGANETIYEASLGAVTYRTDETVIAYQGGGVWRHRNGGTTMVSPPEFHYRGTTLTLPVIRVRSTDAASGRTTAIVRRASALRRIYPNETDVNDDGVGAPYDIESPDGSIRQYRNPVRNGTVAVTVHSRFYEGWADYFRTRTTGTVSVDDDNRTATVVLESAGEVGAFSLPAKNEGVAVRGMAGGHSVTDFEVSVEKDHGTFNNIFVSFYIEEGDRAYEAVVEVPDGMGNYCDGGPGSETLTMDVYYGDKSTPEGVHRWTNDSIPADTGPVRLACEGDGTVIEIDFTSSAQTLTYGSSSVDEETKFDWDERNESATERANPISFNHTGEDGENTTYYVDDEQTLRILTRHYFAKFAPGLDVSVYHGPGNRGTTQIDTSASGGTLRYETVAGTSYITYLHVTENNVTVRLE
ncbi:MAG: hypothetical protein ABEK02_05750 [Haloquadratum sp.]